MKKTFFLQLIAYSLCLTASSQSVAINTDGSSPNASAMLDVKNPNKGLLVPRVALTANNVSTPVTAPAVSLLIYNTATTGGGNGVTPGYYYWNGSAWVQLATGTSSGGTGWLLTGNAGSADATDFIGTTDNMPFNVRVNNEKAGRIDPVLKNAFWGYQAGRLNTTGTNNTVNGNEALFSNTTGFSNTADGADALRTNTSGHSNTATGTAALRFNTEGLSNTATGYRALLNNITGNYNTALGSSTLVFNSTGYSNVAIGYAALFNNYNTSNLVAVGDSALYNNRGVINTAVGSKALYSNTTGYSNAAHGYQALYSNISGHFNTATGTAALRFNTLGHSSTATGYTALLNNTTGNYNTALGTSALFSNSTGYSNVAIGFEALHDNISASNLVAVGDSALYNNSAANNTAVGSKALYNNTNGINNTAIGFDAGGNSTTGNNNTYLGYSAEGSAVNLTNSTAIGYQASVNASNKIRLGNSAVTVIEGQVAYSFPSDARFKYNIKNNVPGLDFIKKLQPVTYYFDVQKLDEYSKTGILSKNIIKPASFTGEKTLHSGFLAQDVEKIAGELGYKFDGVHAPANDKDHYSLAYSQFIMPLVKSVQELSAKNDLLEKKQQEMNELIDGLQKQIDLIKSKQGK